MKKFATVVLFALGCAHGDNHRKATYSPSLSKQGYCTVVRGPMVGLDCDYLVYNAGKHNNVWRETVFCGYDAGTVHVSVYAESVGSESTFVAIKQITLYAHDVRVVLRDSAAYKNIWEKAMTMLLEGRSQYKLRGKSRVQGENPISARCKRSWLHQ